MGLQKSQFLTEKSTKMNHFRPTSRGEDLGEHLDVFKPLPCSGGSLPQKKNPSWEEPLQKFQFLTENSLKMSHFRPTSRGEDLGEYLDVCGHEDTAIIKDSDQQT